MAAASISASISQPSAFDARKTVRSFPPESRSCARTQSQFAKCAAGAVGGTRLSHARRRFDHKPVYLQRIQVVRGSGGRRCLCWNLPSRRKKRNFCFKFSRGSCATTERKPTATASQETWEFAAIWRCLGNALWSWDLNCYSLYLQEFRREAEIQF